MIKSKFFVLLTVVVASTLLFGQVPSTKLVLNSTGVKSDTLKLTVILVNISDDTLQYSGGQFDINVEKGDSIRKVVDYKFIESQLKRGMVNRDFRIIRDEDVDILSNISGPMQGAGRGQKIASHDSIVIFSANVILEGNKDSRKSPEFFWRVMPEGNPVTKFGAYIKNINTEIQHKCTFQTPGKEMIGLPAKTGK